jgi:hypothetical protein
MLAERKSFPAYAIVGRSPPDSCPSAAKASPVQRRSWGYVCSGQPSSACTPSSHARPNSKASIAAIACSMRSRSARSSTRTPLMFMLAPRAGILTRREGDWQRGFDHSRASGALWRDEGLLVFPHLPSFKCCHFGFHPYCFAESSAVLPCARAPKGLPHALIVRGSRLGQAR